MVSPVGLNVAESWQNILEGKSGIETYQEIKVLYPRVSVIMLTGHASLDAAIEGMKTGAFDYLVKPIKIEELVEKIELAHRHKQPKYLLIKTELR